MALWIDQNNKLHDDMGGEALSLTAWPLGLLLATPAQIQAIQNPVIPPQPNVAGFIQALKAVLSITKIAATPTLSNYATWVFNALAIGQWADAQTLIITANTALIISPAEYAAIKSAVTQFNLPMTLP